MQKNSWLQCVHSRVHRAQHDKRIRIRQQHKSLCARACAATTAWTVSKRRDRERESGQTQLMRRLDTQRSSSLRGGAEPINLYPESVPGRKYTRTRLGGGPSDPVRSAPCKTILEMTSINKATATTTTMVSQRNLFTLINFGNAIKINKTTGWKGLVAVVGCEAMKGRAKGEPYVPEHPWWWLSAMRTENRCIFRCIGGVVLRKNLALLFMFSPRSAFICPCALISRTVSGF